MHPSRISPIFICLTALLPGSFAGSGTASTATASSTVPTSRVTTYPVCGAKGFTEEPGDHDMGPLNCNMTLSECHLACRSNGTCQAVSYAEVYSLCSFYSESMKNDQLDMDNSSNFAHYDNACKLNCSLET